MTTIDIYTENYFFFIFKMLYDPNTIIDNEDGNSLIPAKLLENKLEYLLHFLEKEEFLKAKKRILEVDNQEELKNFDRILEKIMIEFWRARKERFRNLIKQFSKICEKENGILTLDNFKEILKPFESNF
jgi:spore coat polysaccharide biosynthesis protein SpsF (cytidylyltransferase family)